MTLPSVERIEELRERNGAYMTGNELLAPLDAARAWRRLPS